MPSTYSSLNYHLVCSTKNRELWLIESVSHLDKCVGRKRGDQLSALADYERSLAIHRRVSMENKPLVAERRLNRMASY
jgi:hypothetical protein